MFLGNLNGGKKLEKDAAKAPHVRGAIVVGLDERNFWCSVPS